MLPGQRRVWELLENNPPFYSQSACSGDFIGSFVGPRANGATWYDLSGRVYIENEKTICIQNLSYNGQGPDVKIFIGLKNVHQAEPNSSGRTIPDERGRISNLRSYNDETIRLKLSGINASQLKWLSIWCEQFAVDFGHVNF
ncbi:unnamed protein product [Gordionus sp. m RMFG-2023]